MSRFISHWQLAAWLVLASVFCWPMGTAGEESSQTGGATGVSPTEAIEHALLRRASFDFDQAPLSEIVEYVSRQFEIEVVLDRRALEANGIALDTPVTRHVHGISLRSGLNLALRELDLTWVVQDEVLLITTLDEAEQILTTKVYSVRDLALPPSGDGKEDYDALVMAIVSTVAPMSWNSVDVGGPGALQAVPTTGSLVVAQTSAVHEAISELLSALREARAKQFPADVPAAGESTASDGNTP